MDYTLLIFGEAERIFGDKAKAAVWLSKRRAAFEGRSALEIVVDVAGYQRVRDELIRLEECYI